MKLCQLLTILFLTFTLFSVVSSVGAVSNTKIQLVPALNDNEDVIVNNWYVFELGDGESRVERVKISNLTDSDIDLKIYVVDSYMSEGQLFLRNEDDLENTYISNWISIDPKFSQFALLAKEDIYIPFNIAIPANTENGEYMGAIIVEEIESQRSGDIVIGTRLGLRVYEFNQVYNHLKPANIENTKVTKLDSGEFLLKSEFGREIKYLDNEISRLGRITNYLFLLTIISIVISIFMIYINMSATHKKNIRPRFPNSF